MEQESFKILEYKRILSRLREKAGTTLGKELAGGLLPSGDREEVRERLQQTAEAVYVSSMAQPPLGGIKDIRESIKKVGLGAVLAPDELLDILTTNKLILSIPQWDISFSAVDSLRQRIEMFQGNWIHILHEVCLEAHRKLQMPILRHIRECISRN